MSFTNSILAGTALIRTAIKSPNYVTGVSGWSINKSGTAEFNDVTVRGDLEIIDPSGSSIHIYNSGGVALIDMTPPDFANATVQSHARAANIYGTIQDLGVGASRGQIGLQSPGFDIANVCQLVLSGMPYDGSDAARITLGNYTNVISEPAIITLNGNINNTYQTDAGNGLISSTGSTSNSGAIGATETVVLSLPSITYKKWRAYRLVATGGVTVSVSNNTPLFRFRKTNTAGQQFDAFRVACIPASTTHGAHYQTYFYVGAADVTAVIVLTLVGTGAYNAVLTGAFSSPATLAVWDHGASGSVSGWSTELV